MLNIPYETFWHLTPKKIKTFEKADEIKTKRRDEENWFLGKYVESAIISTVCNAYLWRGKNTKPYEYVKTPFLQRAEREKINNKPLTEEEKKEQTEMLFTRLQIMGANFNLNHKND